MVVVGSTNPAKLEPVRRVFAEVFPGLEVRGVEVPSGVRAQPIGYHETLQGALESTNHLTQIRHCSYV